MRYIIILLAICSLSLTATGQERLFSLGYARTFVSKDSSSVNFTLDLNRIPGTSEKPGGFYFINEVIGATQWGYYLKPTVDINIGSAVSSSPNNISVGIPFGLSYDFKRSDIGIFSLFIEGPAEMIADREFKNNLYNHNVNSFLKFELANDLVLLNVLLGASVANGVRHQIDTNQTNYYGRVTIPFYFKIAAWNASTKRTDINGVEKGKDFRRISWTGSVKYNYVHSDDRTVNSGSHYVFLSSKFDFYFIPNLGLNISYNYGNEEPVFKQNHSVTVGLTLAR